MSRFMNVQSEFRFTTSEMEQLYQALRFPAQMKKNGYVFTGEEVFLMGLHNMAHSWTQQQYVDHMFGRSDTAIGLGQRLFINHINTNFARKLTRPGALRAWHRWFPVFSERIHNRCMRRTTGRLGWNFGDNFRCFAIVDCILEKTARPGSGPLKEGAGAPRRPNANQIQQSFWTGYLHFNGE